MMRQIIGDAQASAAIPKASEDDFVKLMAKCNVKQLTDDQRFAFQALFATNKDVAGLAPVLTIL
jgi:hypothetical protein